MRPTTLAPALAGAALALSACSATDLGGGNSLVTGSAGQSGGAYRASADLERCDEPLGTVALVEQQSPGLAQVGLQSPLPLIRLMAAQSNCFFVVERGQALSRMEQERELAAGGLLQQGSNVGGAQVVAADYFLTPNVTFSDRNAGGLGALGGLLSNSEFGSLVNRVAGDVRFQEAESVLILTDTRTGVQTAIAEGSARVSDLGGDLGLGSLAGFGGVDGYSDTAEGKVVAGALLDAFNNLVHQARAAGSTG